MTYRFGDVLLATLVFPDGSGAKRRPILVVHDTRDADLLAVPVSSHRPRSPEDVALRDWAAAGLRLASTARMAKLATVGKANMVRVLGRLSDDDLRATRATLTRFFSTMLL